MKLLWWKIYFWISLFLLLLGIVGQVVAPVEPMWLFAADGVLYSIALVGVFSYVFRKVIFNNLFWKGFFWFTIVYTLLYILYAIAPDAPGINLLSFLAYQGEEDALITGIIGVLLSIPYLLATYRLSKGQYFVPPTKLQEQKKAKVFRWGMTQTALWGYSIVLLVVIGIVSLFPSDVSSSTASNDLSGSAIFAPILFFWLWVAFDYKMYQLNWWKTTLLLNSLLFSSIILFGSFFFESIPEETSSGESAIIGILQFTILFVALVVFGREQIQPKKEAKPQELSQ